MNDLMVFEICAGIAEKYHGVDEGDIRSDVAAGRRIATAIRDAAKVWKAAPNPTCKECLQVAEG